MSTSPNHGRTAWRVAVRLYVSLTLGVLFLWMGEICAFGLLSFRSKPAVRPIDPMILQAYHNPDWLRRVWPEYAAAKAQTEYIPYVLWRTKPYHGETIQIDADGLRRTLSSHCSGANYTIWMFGDSALWGSKVPDWGTIPTLLARRYEESGRQICVRNFGEIGWTSTQELIELMVQLKRTVKKPDVVVFYDGDTDLEAAYESKESDTHLGIASFKNMFEWENEDAEKAQSGFQYLQETNTYNLLTYVATRLGIQNAVGAKKDIFSGDAFSMAKSAFDNYLHNLEMVDALGERYGFARAFIWHPVLLGGRKPLSILERKLKDREEKKNPGLGGVLRAGYDLCRATVRPGLYYLGDVFNHREESLYIDENHLGPEGNRIISEEIFRILEEN